MIDRSEQRDQSSLDLLLAAWIVALLSTLGALFIGEVMGQAPCNLCWFQRSFMFPLAVMLAVACYISDTGVWRYALPVAALGGLVAFYHSLLYAGVIPAGLEPCGDGPSCSSANMLVFGRVPIPFLSFGAFAAITVLLVVIRRRFVA
jgi:disulfide bond formation protein DsbB